MTSEGIKTVFKGNILDNTIIEGRSLRAYNQYLPMGRFWRLQENKLIFKQNLRMCSKKSLLLML